MSAELRAARDALVADDRLHGHDFGRALAALLDDALRDAAAALAGRSGWSLLALGSYARRELCPGSDVDVMLLHAGGRRGAGHDDAAAVWYPLWDAGFVLGHATRTVKEAVSLADADLDALTSMLDTRLVAGDDALATDLVDRVRALAPKRRARLIDDLAAGARARFDQPGAIAEVLAPNLKDGAGGLRDVQAAGWVGWALASTGAQAATGDGWSTGVGALVAQGYLRTSDVERLARARDELLAARVALHRATGRRVDQLSLQEQDAVAALVGARDADELLRGLGAASRSVVWITTDLWQRLQSTQRGPGGRGSGERSLGGHVILRDGRVALARGDLLDTAAVLALAARAAELDAPFDRDTLEVVAELPAVEWSAAARDDFIALLGAGRGTVAVFETLDHVGLLVRLLPEWEHVRARAQRNPYHRFTVDRHSLEAVVECVAVLDDATDDDGLDRDIARRARRDVLLLAALLHDIGKGMAGDHSVVGVDLARAVAARIGVDADGTDRLAWLVRNHLLLADTATRRDLADERTIKQFADAVGDRDQLDLLYALTLADSRATGLSAWTRSKAALVRELFVKTVRYFDHGTIATEDPAEALLARCADARGARATSVTWDETDGDALLITVVAPDRAGMLARVAGALAVLGVDIAAAQAVTDDDGMAVEEFVGRDRFDRLATPSERDTATTTIIDALEGAVALDDRLRERARRYRKPVDRREQRAVSVVVDVDASDVATVVEVHAPDDVGLLARVAEAFADLELDVTRAIASTVGDRVVDVFYLRDDHGAKITDAHAIESLRATLLARLTREVTLD